MELNDNTIYFIEDNKLIYMLKCNNNKYKLYELPEINITSIKSEHDVININLTNKKSHNMIKINNMSFKILVNKQKYLIEFEKENDKIIMYLYERIKLSFFIKEKLLIDRYESYDLYK
jgi:hypothetical protein